MTSFRSIASAFAALGILASVALADVALARREMGFAKDQIDRDERLEEAFARLTKAEQALSNVPEAEKAPILAEIRALRDEANRKQKVRDVRSAEGQLEREYRQLEEAARGEGNRGAGLFEVANVEPMFVRMERMLVDPTIVRQLQGTPKLEEWRQKTDALKGVAMRTVFNHCVAEAEKYLEKVEKVNKGEEDRSEDSVEQWLGIALREIEKLADTDPRKDPLKARHRADVQARDRRLATDSKEHAITAFREHWAHMQRQYAGNAQGWERENAYELSQWWREHGNMNLERTEAYWNLAAQARDDERWTKAVEAHGDDARVKEIVAEVERITLESSKKICAAADRLLDGADAKVAEDPEETKQRVLRVVEKLEKYSGDCPEGAAVLAKGRALLSRIHKIQVDGADPGPASTTPTPTATTEPTPAGEKPGDAAAERTPEAEGGGPGLLGMALGCMCCLFSIAGAGGAAFFVMKQQKAAAAAAPPPAA